jgi:hypothetical protein
MEIGSIAEGKKEIKKKDINKEYNSKINIGKEK